MPAGMAIAVTRINITLNLNGDLAQGFAQFRAPTAKLRATRKPGSRKRQKKNCNKGIYCVGASQQGTCISAKKTCQNNQPSPGAKAAYASKPKGKGGGLQSQIAEKEQELAALRSQSDALGKAWDKEDDFPNFDSPNWKQGLEVDAKIAIAEKALVDLKAKQLREVAIAGKDQAAKEAAESAKALLADGVRLAGEDRIKQLDSVLEFGAIADRGNPKLYAEVKALEAEVNVLMDTMDIGEVFKTPQSKRLDEKLQEFDRLKPPVAAIDLMTEIRESLKQRGGMTRAKAEELAAGVKILKSASRRVEEAELRKGVADFFEISGGAGAGNLKKLTYKDPRAWASEDGEVNIGWGTGRSLKIDLFHEIGHQIEFENLTRMQRLNDWIDSRSTGEIKPLGPGYEADEVARVDKLSIPTLANPTEAEQAQLKPYQWEYNTLRIQNRC